MKKKGDLLWLAKSSVQKQTLTPEWNDTVKVETQLAGYEQNELVLELWDQDSLVDDFIGTGSVTLPGASSLSYGQSFTIKFYSKKQEDEGEAQITFTASQILSKKDLHGLSNPLYETDAVNPLYGGDL